MQSTATWQLTTNKREREREKTKIYGHKKVIKNIYASRIKRKLNGCREKMRKKQGKSFCSIPLGAADEHERVYKRIYDFFLNIAQWFRP